MSSEPKTRSRHRPGTDSGAGSPAAREGWSVPKPEALPRPTVWPAAAALGIVFTLWGVVTTYLIATVGVILLGIATLGWIGELRHEQ